MTRLCRVSIGLLVLALMRVGPAVRAQGTSETVFAGRVTGGTVWSLLLRPDDGGTVISIPVGEDGRFRHRIAGVTAKYILATDPPCTPISLQLADDATGALSVVRADRPEEVMDVNAAGVSSLQTVRTGYSFRFTPGGGVAFSTPTTTQVATFDSPGSRVTSGSLGLGNSGRLTLSMSNMVGGVRMTTGVCDQRDEANR